MNNGSSNNQNSGMLPVIVLGICLMGAAFYGIWTFKHAALSYFYMKWRYYEILPFSFILPYADGVRAALLEAMTHSAEVPFSSLRAAGNQVGIFYVPIVIVMGGLFIKQAMSLPILKSYRVHTPNSLMEAQSRNFTAILPIIDIDLTDNTSPRWAVSRRPEEFARDYNLVTDGKLDRDRARQVLIEQLGRKIDHPDNLFHHEKAIFSIFAARIIDGREASQALTDALNRSARNKTSRPNYRVAQQAYLKYRNAPVMLDILRAHPYARTYLFALLLKARDTGVLPSSEFIWLKPNDRGLWYPLNSAGRKKPFTDAAAVFAQYQAETIAQQANRELINPYVERAIDGLAGYLKKIGVTNEDNNDSYHIA